MSIESVFGGFCAHIVQLSGWEQTPPPRTSQRRRAASASLSESEHRSIKKRQTKKNGRQSNLAGSVDNFTDELKEFKESIIASSSASTSVDAHTQMLMEIATPVRRKKAITLLEGYGMSFILFHCISLISILSSELEAEPMVSLLEYMSLNMAWADTFLSTTNPKYRDQLVKSKLASLGH